MNKLIAPIVISVILLLFYFLALVGVAISSASIIYKFIALVVISALICVVVFVMMERIDEIRSGVEDDLSNY